MITDLIQASFLSAQTVRELGTRGDRLIEELQMQYPIDCFLYDSRGCRLASFKLGDPEPAENFCDEAEARRRCSAGATLTLTDSLGRTAEVVLQVAASARLQ
jgi:hypothetical protein